jgi:hypothetical protein
MVYNDIKYGPCFGGGFDICIKDKADKNQDSYALINHTFCNSLYNYKNKESF